jgi:P27 family predicted phage terminase small subunit
MDNRRMVARDPIDRKRLTGRSPGRDSGGRPLPDHQMVVLPGQVSPPPVPEGLGAAGRSAWARLWSAAPWLAPDTDTDLMFLLCAAYDQWDAMHDRISEDGLMVTGSTGQQRSHPLLTQLRALEGSMTRWMRSLGFTPLSRSQLGASEIRRVSRLDEMMARRQAGRLA